MRRLGDAREERQGSDRLMPGAGDVLFDAGAPQCQRSGISRSRYVDQARAV